MSTVLVIAGSDSSGGAGITRDVRTLTQLGTRALCVVTAVTAQSHTQLCATHIIPPGMVQAQMAAALATCRPGAIKIGMLATAATVLAVAAALPSAGPPVVLDPVLASSSGGELLEVDIRRRSRRRPDRHGAAAPGRHECNAQHPHTDARPVVGGRITHRNRHGGSGGRRHRVGAVAATVTAAGGEARRETRNERAPDRAPQHIALHIQDPFVSWFAAPAFRLCRL